MAKLAVLSLALGLCFVTFSSVQAQNSGVIQSLSFFNMTEDNQILTIAQYLAGNDDVTRKLIKIAQSLEWLQQGSGGDMAGMVIPYVLDSLPDILSSNATKFAAFLAQTELEKVPVNLTAMVLETMQLTAPYHVPPWSQPFNETLQKLVFRYKLDHANWLRAVNNFVNQMSARQLLYEDPQSNVTTVSPQCYSDTMDFVDAIVGTQQKNSFSDVEHYMWALKMFDSFGKVSGGLFKGSLYYPGSYDECHTIHAYIPANSTMLLGGRTHDYVTEFDTRFCRVTFDLPSALTQSFGVDTHGIELRLHWGMCMPKTCKSDDIAAMFHLGMLKGLNLSVNTVFCADEQEINKDASAIVAAVIIGILAGVVGLCSLIEAYIIFYNNNMAPPPTPASSMEDGNALPASKEYSNPAYVPDGKDHTYETIKEKGDITLNVSAPSGVASGSGSGGVVPVGYMHHKEGTPVFKYNLPPIKGGTPPEQPIKGATPPEQPIGVAEAKEVEAKRTSPPPSYSKAAGNPNHLKPPKIVAAFSLLTNMPKVLSGAKSPSAIHCLHGIRFFSLCWVILGHTYNYGVVSVVENPTTVNLVDADSIFKRFTFQGVMAGGYAVDTFFLLSGLLVTWLTLRDLAKKNSIGYWIMFYVHRFWRLTPLYMIVIMVFTCLHTYMGSGPLWPQNLKTAMDCKKNWWTNLLYVNNLVETDNMCLGWTWYLANDMQFYWISPIFLLVLTYHALWGVLITSLLLLLGIVLAFYFEYINGGDVFSMHENGSHYWEQVYITPWCRVAAYAVGMLLGYVFHKFKRRTLSMKASVIGWAVTWVAGVFLCYITYSKRKEGGTEWPRWWEALFESVGRPLWAACVGWIIFACHNNRGGFINSILSWTGFLPLSRLTYAAYLVHPVVMMIHVYSKRALIYISDFDMAYLFMGHFVTSFLAAFVFSVCAEAPALALEKLLFRLR